MDAKLLNPFIQAAVETEKAAADVDGTSNLSHYALR